MHFAYLCWDTLPGSLGMSIAADFLDSLPPPAGLVPLARELEGSKLVGPSWSKTSMILFSEGQNGDPCALTQEVGDPTKMGYLRVALAFLPAVHEASAQARFQVSSWKPPHNQRPQGRGAHLQMLTWVWSMAYSPCPMASTTNSQRSFLQDDLSPASSGSCALKYSPIRRVSCCVHNYYVFLSDSKLQVFLDDG